MNELVVAIICGLVIILGTLGAVLPILPGLPLALAGLLTFALITKSIPVWGLVVFSILTALTIVVDIFAPAIAAKGKKASDYGVAGAIIGAIFGIFLLGPIGILLGPFAGAFIGEMIHSANSDHAFQVAIAAVFGLVIGSLFKLVVGTSMFVYFILHFF